MDGKLIDDKIKVIIQAAGFIPAEPYSGSKRPWKGIHAKCGKVVYPTLNKLQQGQGCCRYCGIKARTEELCYTDEQARVIAFERCPNFLPIDAYPGNNKRPWRGIHRDCGGEVTPSLANLNQGRGCCLACGIKARTLKLCYTDEQARAIAFERCPNFEPGVKYPGNALRPWRGIHRDCGGAVSPRLANLQQGLGCCQKCAGNLQFTDEQARALAFEKCPDFKPVANYPGGAGLPWLGEHQVCKHSVSPRLAELQRGKGCCQKCAGNLQFTDEQARALAFEKCPDFKPVANYPGGVGLPWSGIHRDCGREVSPRLSGLQQGRGCCLACGIKARTLKLCYTDEQARAIAFERCPNFLPIDVYPGTNRQVWRGKHRDCGGEVSPSLYSLKQGYGCCKKCRIYGFNPYRPGYWYLVRADEDGALKHGITNSLKKRLTDHKRQGFGQLIYLISFDVGKAAESFERKVKTELRRLELTPARVQFEMPQGGWTETFNPLQILESQWLSSNVRWLWELLPTNSR